MKQAGIWLFAALWIICFVFWRFQGGYVSGFLFYVVSLLCLYEVLVWLSGGVGWEVKTEVERRTWMKGDDMVVCVRIQRRIPLPFVWLDGAVILPRRLWHAYHPEGTLRLLWFARRIEWRYRLSPLPRGKFRFPDVQLTCGDLFGLVVWKRLFPQEQREFVVYPRWRPLHDWSFGAGVETGVHASFQRMAKMQRDEGMVTGVRDWQPGDRLSQIHWKASARSGDLKTKWLEFSGSRNMLIVLDVHQDSYRALESDLFERGVELALSLAHAVQASGLGVGLCAAGQEMIWLEPKADPQYLQRIAYALACVEADGEIPLSELLRMPSTTADGNVELAVITPVLDTAMTDAIRKRMHGLRQKPCRVYWLANGRDDEGYSKQVALQRLGVPVYRVDDRWSPGLETVPDKGGGVDGVS